MKKIERLVISFGLIICLLIIPSYSAVAATNAPTNVKYNGIFSHTVKWTAASKVSGYEIKVKYSYSDGTSADTEYFRTGKTSYKFNSGLTSCDVWVRSYKTGKDGKQVSKWVKAQYSIW